MHRFRDKNYWKKKTFLLTFSKCYLENEASNKNFTRDLFCLKLVKEYKKFFFEKFFFSVFDKFFAKNKIFHFYLYYIIFSKFISKVLLKPFLNFLRCFLMWTVSKAQTKYTVRFRANEYTRNTGSENSKKFFYPCTTRLKFGRFSAFKNRKSEFFSV